MRSIEQRKGDGMNKLVFTGEVVFGEMDMDTTKMVCVPVSKYSEVSICLKSNKDTGSNIVVSQITSDGLKFHEKEKLGFEIEKRWNGYKQLLGFVEEVARARDANYGNGCQECTVDALVDKAQSILVDLPKTEIE